MSLLFSKRSKKTIKIIWGVFSVLIALSMVIAYSGFTRLTSTPAPANNQNADGANTADQVSQVQVNNTGSTSAQKTILQTEPATTPLRFSPQ